jgi:hypothetical protein
MLARRAVWTVAGAERDLAQAEVIAELGPLGVRRLPVLFAGPLAAPVGDELPVVPDHLFGVNRDISLRGVQVEMTQETGGDVDGQAAVDGLGGKDPSGSRAG